MKNRSSLLLLAASVSLLSVHAIAQTETPSSAASAATSPDNATNSDSDASDGVDAADSHATDPQTSPGSGVAARNTDKRKKKRKHDDADAGLADDAPVAQADGAPNADEAPREETLDGDSDGPASSAATLGRFRLMYQLRYKYTYVDPIETSRSPITAQQQRGTLKEQDGYDIQRAFLRYTAKPSKYIGAKFLVDFAELRHENVRQAFKLAYIQIHPTKSLEFDVGLLKRTYSLLELLPIVDHELADLGPTDSYIKDAGFGGRDLGAVVRYRPLQKRSSLMVSLGAFRGDIDEGYDSHALKVLTARIEAFPWKHLRLGLNGALRPYDNVQMKKLEDADGEKYYSQVVTLNKGAAVGADASLIFKRLQLRAEGLYGDRTDVGRPLTASRFVSTWLVVAPNFKLGPVKFVPAAKAELLDLNPQGRGGRRVLFTGVLGVIPIKNLRLIVDVTRTLVEHNTPAMSNVPWTSGKSSLTIAEPSSTTKTFQIQHVF